MRIKLDENLGDRGANLLRSAGWDVATVASQDLCASSDATLAEICRIEARTLLSLDTDFANTLRFHPRRHAGLVVLRLPQPLRRERLEGALSRFIELSASRSPAGKLWIVDDHRIREFVERDDDRP